jgi:hypothetical protein
MFIKTKKGIDVSKSSLNLYDQNSVDGIRPSLRTSRESKMMIPAKPKLKASVHIAFKNSHSEDQIEDIKPQPQPQLVEQERPVEILNAPETTSVLQLEDFDHEAQIIDAPSSIIEPENEIQTQSDVEVIEPVQEQEPEPDIELPAMEVIPPSLEPNTKDRSTWVFGLAGATATITLVGFGYFLGARYTIPNPSYNSSAVLSESVSRDILAQANSATSSEPAPETLTHPNRLQILSSDINSPIVAIDPDQSGKAVFSDQSSSTGWVSSTAKPIDTGTMVLSAYYGGESTTVKTLDQISLDSSIQISTISGDIYNYKVAKIETLSKDLVQKTKTDSAPNFKIMLLLIPESDNTTQLASIIYAN